MFSIIFNLAHFFEWKVEQNHKEKEDEFFPDNEDSYRNFTTDVKEDTLYHISYTDFRANEMYYKIYWVGLTITFGGIIPYLTLTILNTFVVKALIRNRHNKGNRSVAMSVKRQLSRVKSDTTMSNDDVELSIDEDNSFRIIHGVKESQRRKTQIDLAKVTIVIVATFIVCHSIKWIPNIYELMVM